GPSFVATAPKRISAGRSRPSRRDARRGRDRLCAGASQASTGGGVSTRIADEGSAAATISDEQVQRRRQIMRAMLTDPADRAAERILMGTVKRQGLVVFTASAITLDLAVRTFPTSYLSVIRLFTNLRTRGRVPPSTPTQ